MFRWSWTSCALIDDAEMAEMNQMTLEELQAEKVKVKIAPSLPSNIVPVKDAEPQENLAPLQKTRVRTLLIASTAVEDKCQVVQWKARTDLYTAETYDKKSNIR